MGQVANGKLEVE